MSAIAILRELMEKLARKRGVEVVHPWQEFDMIGGTSTVSKVALHLVTRTLTLPGRSFGHNAWPSPYEYR